MNDNNRIIKIIRDILTESVIDEDNLPTKGLPNISLKEKLPQLKGDRFDVDFKLDDNVGEHDIQIMSSCFSPNTIYDFIITTDGIMRIGYGHYRLADKSEKILGAGELMIDNSGKISYLNNESGHYKPSRDDIYQIYKLFNDMKLTTKNCVVDIKH